MSRVLRGLCLLVLSVVARHDVLQPYELIAHRNTGTQRCTHLILRDTQIFRALPDAGYQRSRTLHSGQERIQFIDDDEDRVWARAETLCGDKSTWDFPTLIRSHTDALYAEDQLVLRPVQEQPLPLEVEPLIISGDSSNRVDLIFFADGYTVEEKDKFIGDARRLSEDLSQNQTFYTVKPLLNFWAAFTPSKESGIGIGGQPKDTAFGLYRDGTELRGVYSSKPQIAHAACFSVGDRCDYPIIVGNDPLYGGLEGDPVTITPSLANGPLVLRHELGHTLIDVGEEYDGGDNYFGVNAAHNTSLGTLSWAHWLTNSSHDHGHQHGANGRHACNTSKPRVERAVMPLQNYAWTLLNTSSAWSTTLYSSGTYAWHLVRFSLSGLPDEADLRVELDGKDLGWVPRKDIGVDRWHYDIKINDTLKEGEHEVKFVLKNGEREGEAQLCSVEVLEFGDESEFVSTPGHYSLYPTFSEKNETSYRPTNEDCLMRIVTTPNFCKACLEGLWHALLRRVALIDEVDVGCSPAGERTLNLALVPLAHLRTDPVDVEESYEITWVKDGVEVEEYKNQTRLVDDGGALGSYAVKVQYRTEEVRVDPNGLLEESATIEVTTRCE